MVVGLANHKEQKKYYLGKAYKTKVRMLVMHAPFREARGKKTEGESWGRGESSYLGNFDKRDI